MATIFWKNGVSGNFATASDWSTGTVPGAGDDAVINAPGTYTVTSTVSETIADMTVGLGATLNVKAGTFTIAGGGGGSTNGGILKATAGATLFIEDNVINAVGSSNGVIEAFGAGSSVGVISVQGGAVAAVNGGQVVIGGGLKDGALNAFGGEVDIGAPSTLVGETLKSSGSGVIKVVAAPGFALPGPAVFDGTTDGPVNTSANIEVLPTAMFSGSTYGGLDLKGSIGNSGTVTVDAGGNLYIDGAVTLSGNGKVVLAGAQISANGNNPGATLTNAGNTISGAGQIGNSGDKNLTLVNRGTVEANVAANTLTINTGNAVNNSALLEATGGATLFIEDNVTNAVGSSNGVIEAFGTGSLVGVISVQGGAVAAVNGGQVVIGGGLKDGALNAFGGEVDIVAPSTLVGETLKSSGSGVIKVTAEPGFALPGPAVFDGTTDGPVNTSANIEVQPTALFSGSTYGGLDLKGSIANSGTVTVDAGGNLYIDGAVTLSGNGKVVLAGAQISANGNNPGATLTNAGNTISGAGQIGNNGDTNLTLVNKGTVDANVAANTLTINTGNAVTNSALLEATGGGTLDIKDSVNNVGGTILASGAGSQVVLDPLTITGGILKTLNGGVIETAINSGEDTIVGASFSNAGTLEANAGSTLDILGGFGNVGLLDANGGDLIVTGKLAGVGAGSSATISNGGAMEFGAASNQNVTFATGANGILKLDKAESYTGTVTGFSGPSGPPTTASTTIGPPPGGGDSLDLADFVFGTTPPSLVFTPTGTSTNPGGTLTVTDGSLVANIVLVGQYSAAGFHEADRFRRHRHADHLHKPDRPATDPVSGAAATWRPGRGLFLET
jgi:hypothetical protein